MNAAAITWPWHVLEHCRDHGATIHDGIPTHKCDNPMWIDSPEPPTGRKFGCEPCGMWEFVDDVPIVPPFVPKAPPPADPLIRECSDTGNGERLVYLHGADFRFVPAWSTWLVWDGKRWAKDANGGMMRFAKATARSISREADHIADDDVRKRHLRHAITSQSRRALEAMIELAKSEDGVSVAPVALDSDPWILNVQNGALDLRAGVLRPHRREDLCTKIAAVAYDADAYCETFAKFVERVLPDPAVQAFVQRAAGYSLLGVPREEVFFFAFGPPASGKSTLLEGIKTTLGDYAATADFEEFLQSRDTGGPRSGIARLAGARFVASVEVDDGRRLAAGLVKQLVGGDTITARFLYGREFEFRPAFTLWLAANDEPKVSDADAALWRRILELPFSESIPVEERDPGVKAAITDPARSGPAVLAWMVAGLRDYLEHGLRPPEAVRRATEEYRERQDPLAEWWAECLVEAPGAEATAAELFKSYAEWATRSGIRRPMTRQQLGKRITLKGFQAEPDKHHTRHGIGVAPRSALFGASGCE